MVVVIAGATDVVPVTVAISFLFETDRFQLYPPPVSRKRKDTVQIHDLKKRK
jgi:hypothetical protein